jgi:glycosyltransferase involved in cell wall biosynthesis
MDNRPTIIHVIDSLGIGGAEILLVNTIPLIKNYEHIVICLMPKEDLKQSILHELKAFYQLGVKGKKDWVKAVFGMRKIIQSNRPALVHAHLQISSLLARMACPANVPLVFTIHSTFSEDAFRHNKLAVWMERLTVRKRHHLIGVSRFVIEDYSRFVPFKGSIHVLYNFIPKKFFKNTQKNYSSIGPGLKIIAVGNLKAAKNYPYLLDAFKLLKDVPVSLDIYGDGPQRETLLKIIEENYLNVRLKGKSGAVDEVMQDYDLYIISSKHEGYGIAPLEAMAGGLPVMASDIPVLREVTAGNALFFDLNNSGDLVRKIKTVLEGKINLQDLALKGQLRAREIASEEGYIKNLNSIYQSIINK